MVAAEGTVGCMGGGGGGGGGWTGVCVLGDGGGVGRLNLSGLLLLRGEGLWKGQEYQEIRSGTNGSFLTLPDSELSPVKN